MKHPITRFTSFVKHLQSRLKKGEETYGDTSFSAHPITLIHELKEEVLDIANWGFILWTRLDDMERKIAALDWDKYEADSDSC